MGLVPNRHFLKHGTGPKQAFLKTWDWIISMKISSPKHTFFNHGTGPKQAFLKTWDLIISMEISSPKQKLDVGPDTEDKSIFNEDFKL